MGVVRKIVSVLATVALAVSFVGVGFLACTTPPVTGVFANLFSDDATSPFSRTQLVQVAEATRDYSFGAHDKLALYQVIYEADLQLRQEIVNANGTLPFGFPNLDAIGDKSSTAQFETAFSGASEMYCYSSDTISHLDDCYNLARTACIALAVAGTIALAGIVFCGTVGRKRLVGRILTAAGFVVVALFAALGVFAALDFQSFFQTFHGVFFSQGNWQFPYDSLLICSLPTAFWTGMAAVWLAVSALASI
ncbi:MAG: DUF1461 domain-containing protein, partial [Eggerthellaceae bacterium]|nr:DUF1461 domain-containing protein [Eggerthellaceae bacterium]